MLEDPNNPGVFIEQVNITFPETVPLMMDVDGEPTQIGTARLIDRGDTIDFDAEFDAEYHSMFVNEDRYISINTHIDGTQITQLNVEWVNEDLSDNDTNLAEEFSTNVE